jgi:SecD/SecF fusion protein
MSDYFDRVERQLVARVDGSVAQRARFPVRLEHLAVAASLLVVLAVAAVFIGIRGSGLAGSPSPARAVRVVFGVSSADPGTPVARGSIARSIAILRHRLDSVSHGVRVSQSGNQVVVVAPASAGISRARIVALAAPAKLAFYDWEANALTRNGKAVASQLQDQDPTALLISQGSGSAAPGDPGAGSLGLYQAVQLASKQPPSASAANARDGKEYFLFGAPGSAGCATAAKDQHSTPVAGVHCLLSGPVDETTTNPQVIAADLASGLPAGVTASQGQELVVPQGTVVLLAAAPTASSLVKYGSPTAQYYVLKDNVALSGHDITNPQQSTDQTGSPDVTFGFSSKGANAFQRVTGVIAHRGDLVSGLGSTLDQHFAVALDNKLITVPSIDFKQYPDGIIGGGGGDVTGGFTTQSARNLAAELRYAALPVNLTVS